MAGIQSFLRSKARWVRRTFIPQMANIHNIGSLRTLQLTEFGNIGVAKIAIPMLGQNEVVFAHSKISYSGQPLAQYFKLVVVPPTFITGLYPNKNGDGQFDRKFDTESKILEYVARKIGHNNKISGHIYLYTERKPCPMCKRVIRQFQRRYPNIRISVYFR